MRISTRSTPSWMVHGLVRQARPCLAVKRPEMVNSFGTVLISRFSSPDEKEELLLLVHIEWVLKYRLQEDVAFSWDPFELSPSTIMPIIVIILLFGSIIFSLG